MRLTPTGQLDLGDPELRLTESQRAAMATDREIVLTAGAGAGKTHTLSLRYVALLLELARRGDGDVEGVLVLTFTEKAAEEMAERCHSRLGALVAAARTQGVDPALRRSLEGLADRFDRARIHTFHAFCATLLHEFPAQTHTPPGGRVLEPAEARRWTARALEDALSDLVRDAPQHLPALLDTFGSRPALLDAGRLALERRGTLQDTLRAHASGRLTLADAVDAAAVTPEQARAWVSRTGLPALGALARLVAPSGGGPFVTSRLRPTLEGVAVPAEDADAVEVFAAYRAVLDTLVTATGTLRALDHHTVLGTRASWPGDRRYRMAKEACRALMGRLGDWAERARASRALPTPADRALLEALEPFCGWVLDAAARLDARLDAERCVTFEVMQLRAVRAVLEDPSLRADLRERFRYLMVDEFQDTDELQWSLVRALARHDPTVPEDRLFLVGDLKQAIYGFRGGDVTVFRRAAEELGVEPLNLPENFRSRPELIEWFNQLFPHVLGTGATERWDAPFEPLRAGRKEHGGTVTLVRGSRDSLGPRWQPDATARLAAELLSTDPALSDRTLNPTPPIAVLLRARTRQDAYEDALRRHGVPFVVARGVGFWVRPEVVDLVNAMSALVHRDPASIAASLRAPWLGLLDQDLQDLHEGRWGGGGLHAFGTEGLSDAAPPRVVRAARTLASMQQLRRRLPPSSLLAALARAMGPSLAASDATGQAAANAARLVDLVGSWDADGSEAVADRLLAEVLAGARESEAVLVATSARVVLCTVHASKGLEFPVVVLPELDARPRSAADVLLVRRPEGGVDWRIAARVLDPDADVQTRVQPGLYASLDHVRRQEEYAEERRLLYVAATRARDRLLLIGEPPTPRAPGARGSWMQLVEEHLPASTLRRAAATLLDGDPPSPAPPPAPDGPGEDARSRIGPVPVRRRLELPASALDRFAACPARWYRGDLLGLPEAAATVVDRAVRLASARGQAIHQILEDALEHDDASVLARWRALAVLQGATEDEVRGGQARLVRHLAATEADPHVRAVLDAPGHTELPFRAEHAGVVLMGRIDRLWRDGADWVVLDWKSEGLAGRSPSEVAARHERQLLAYAWAADQVLGARGLGAVGRGEVYLTAIGHAEVLGPWDASVKARVPALLEDVARVAQLDWADVEAEATGGAVERPCGTCGFRGRGCRGR